MRVSDWQARSPVIETVGTMATPCPGLIAHGQSPGRAKPNRSPSAQALRSLPWLGMPGASNPGQMHQVPGHDRGVASGELVVETGTTAFFVVIAKGRPRPRLADPPAIGLRRDGVAEVVQREAEAHRDMLDPVFVAGDDGNRPPFRRRRTALPRSAGPTLRRAVRFSTRATELSSPSQSGVPITRICAALTFSHSIGQSSRSQPCSVMSG